MKILVLYEELAWYFVNCMNVLCREKGCEVVIFCKKNNPNAPFQFKYIHPSITLKDRSDYSTEQLLAEAQKFNPAHIFLAGWVYKPYLDLVKKLNTKSCVLGLDNQWQGSARQIAGALYFRLSLKRYITAAFVPGPQQYTFAQKLGFKKQNIEQGAYCCDFDLFHTAYLENKTQKEAAFPKRFLFVGRYAAEKGITDLWSSFIELQQEQPSEWELWCLGKGEIKAVEHPKIKHFGFLQPEELDDVIKNTGVFVLPSTFEPWGVVIHEYAAAGYPVLCTDKVGAATVLLTENENGYSISAGNKEELKLKLKKFTGLTGAELNVMSAKSAAIAGKITPHTWANSLMKLYGYN